MLVERLTSPSSTRRSTEQSPAWWLGAWSSFERKLDNSQSRAERIFQLQSGRIDTTEARLEAEARKSEEALKNVQGHLPTIDLARHKDLHRVEACMSELDQKIRANIGAGNSGQNAKALQDIT